MEEPKRYKAFSNNRATPKSAKVINRLEGTYVARYVGPGNCLFDHGKDFASMCRIAGKCAINHQ